MADLGYRSIEIVVVNDTQTDLSIQQAGDPSSGSWIDGERPTDGMVISPFSKKRFGVRTADPQSTARAAMRLSGRGSLAVELFNAADGGPDVVFTTPIDDAGEPPLGMRGTATPVDTSEPNHAVFIVQITPTVATGPARG